MKLTAILSLCFFLSLSARGQDDDTVQYIHGLPETGEMADQPAPSDDVAHGAEAGGPCGDEVCRGEHFGPCLGHRRGDARRIAAGAARISKPEASIGKIDGSGTEITLAAPVAPAASRR